MSGVHKFKEIYDDFKWEGVDSTPLEIEGIEGAVKNILIGEKDGAPHFIMRYFQLAPDGHSKLERHVQEHEVIILKGKGVVQIGDHKHKVAPFDTVFIEGNELHQFSNPHDTPFGFVCVIPKLD